MSDMQDQAAQDSLLKTAASESDSQASSAAQSLSHNSADQSMQPLLRSPCRTLLSNLRGERPNPQQHYKVGIYIRYFNQTKHVDYLDYHVKQYQDTMALCPNWELIDFYIDEGATAPNMESAPEWCRLLQDCFRGKVNLITHRRYPTFPKRTTRSHFLQESSQRWRNQLASILYPKIFLRWLPAIRIPCTIGACSPIIGQSSRTIFPRKAFF